MKAQELRIGNLYYYKMVDKCDERKEWEEVTAIDAMDIDHLLKFPDDPDYRAIPLTEEILRDWCGLIETYGSFSIDLPDDERIDVRKDGTAALWASDGCTEGHCLHVECKYLHQLQNLYFALTGEELEIKLPKQ